MVSDMPDSVHSAMNAKLINERVEWGNGEIIPGNENTQNVISKAMVNTRESDKMKGQHPDLQNLYLIDCDTLKRITPNVIFPIETEYYQG